MPTFLISGQMYEPKNPRVPHSHPAGEDDLTTIFPFRQRKFRSSQVLRRLKQFNKARERSMLLDR